MPAQKHHGKFSRAWFVALLFLMLGCGVTAELLFRWQKSLAKNPATRDLRLETYDGAWGRIDALRMPLVNPDGPFPDEDQRLADPKWFFENVSEERLVAFLRSCNLPPDQLQRVLKKDCWRPTTNGYAIAPPLSVVWSLSSESRACIYSVLGRSAANYQQYAAFRFPANAFRQCLSTAGISPRGIEELQRLAYTNRASVCLADLEIAKRLLRRRDFDSLMATLYEFPTYRVRLCMNSDADIVALEKYWSGGQHNNSLKPLLTSLSHVPGGVNMNVSFVLPAFARLRLYTYPQSSADPAMSGSDCFFSALNFFNDAPNTNFLNAEIVQKVLSTEYAPAQGAPMFGDLLLLLNDERQAIHASVYLAASFVFTKNGVNPSQPWVIMKTNDMMETYFGPKGAGQAVFLRRRTEHQRT
jgi:hypothetical protein